MQHGNELIDSKVKRLFNHLLYSKKDYYIGPDKLGGALFNIDNTEIKLTWFKKSKSTKFSNDPITISNFSFTFIPYWETCPEDASGYVFYIEILPYGRQLIVPELSRLEEAKALSQLEYFANSKEFETLDRLNKFISDDNCD